MIQCMSMVIFRTGCSYKAQGLMVQCVYVFQGVNGAMCFKGLMVQCVSRD